MPLKEANEITVKIKTNKQQFIDLLLSKGFIPEKQEQCLEDYYFIPSNLDTQNTSVRDILSNAVIIRNLYNKANSISKRLCHKIKKFNDKDEIIEQTQYNLEINNCQDAKVFLESIGYKQIIYIKEIEYIFIKDEFSLEVKEVINGDLLMEVETTDNKNFDTLEKIKNQLIKLDLPIDTTNYFVKKAEIELQKVLQK